MVFGRFQYKKSKLKNNFQIFTVKTEIMKRLGGEEHWSVLPKSREHLIPYEPKTVEDLPFRSMRDSFTSAIIPLSTDLAIRDKYVTFLGSVRLGRLMEDMDLFAVWVLHKHVKLPNLDPSIPLPYTFVTLMVDQISFTDIVPKVSKRTPSTIPFNMLLYKKKLIFSYFLCSSMILIFVFLDMYLG